MRPFDRHEKRTVLAAFAELDRFRRAGVGEDGPVRAARGVAAVKVPAQEQRRARSFDLGLRERRRDALVRRATVLVAAVHERDLHAAALEARAGERPARLGRGVPVAEERDPLGERDRAPARFVERAHVRRQIVTGGQRRARVRIVIPRSDEDGLAEPRELLEQEACRLRAGALGFAEVAPDRQRVGPAGEGEVDDPDERVRERLAPGVAAAQLRERRLQVHVGTVSDRILHSTKLAPFLSRADAF